MIINAQTLALSQLLSPSFPVGAFAYSHGLEAAIESGAVSTAEQLKEWLSDVLDHGGGRADATLVTLAAASGSNLEMLNAHALAFAPSAERLKEADLQGAAFCNAVRDGWGIDLGRLTYPVAVGAMCKEMTLDATTAVSMYLLAFVTNLANAAQRLMPLGQAKVQNILNDLRPMCLQITHDVADCELDDLTSCAFLSDIVSMQHETQTVRLFKT